jgi:hypothetical protein
VLPKRLQQQQHSIAYPRSSLHGVGVSGSSSRRSPVAVGVQDTKACSRTPGQTVPHNRARSCLHACTGCNAITACCAVIVLHFMHACTLELASPCDTVVHPCGAATLTWCPRRASCPAAACRNSDSQRADAAGCGNCQPAPAYASCRAAHPAVASIQL